jgi:hypothetical protein
LGHFFEPLYTIYLFNFTFFFKCRRFLPLWLRLFTNVFFQPLLERLRNKVGLGLNCLYYGNADVTQHFRFSSPSSNLSSCGG